MRGYGDARFTEPSQQFDAWLTDTASLPAAARNERLEAWQTAPSARLCHPKAEHLLPLMIAAGASEEPGKSVYAERVLETAISGFQFP
jgi:aromatic ring-opening dioxygenase catalytic subunit (LigB family)